MTAHGAPSSSSSKSKLWNYDMFLSFSGVDTRNGFTGHLHAALTDRGYQAYIDEEDLKRGEEIKEELFRAIEESSICIIVFSKRYADSSWCLDELVKIMDCRSKLGRHVLPIFYHVDPSHVRKQEGDLAEAFQKHEEGIGEEKDDKKHKAKQERVKQWREALTEAANLSGHHLQITDNGHEVKLIKEIIDKIITEWLPSTNKLHVAKHQVGINSRVQDIISHLSSGVSNEVVIIGIWGMGGVGKTTAAKAIYNQIHHMFQFKSFLANISDTASKHGLVYLQETLVSDILKHKSQISSVDGGISLIKQHFQHRRVLVIMDNIDEVEQLDAIVGNRDWFGPGSRIIITTRDEHLLKQVKVDKTYSAQKMNEEEALELFSWHAFENSWPNKGYLELSRKVVAYCGGLPLALEVLGSFFTKRTIAEWKSQLKKLERIPDGKIIKPLRISFEGLDDTHKAIFLDISCFFIGKDKDYVVKVLDGCEFFATIGIGVLCERCLVTLERNKLNMHDLLREMAKVIISEKFVGHPEKWSRLWNPRDVIDVLTNKFGTEEVEGLALGPSEVRLHSTNKSSFSTVAFANMKKLRLLQLNNVELNGEYKHLSKELIWLCWHGFPLQSIPDDFFNQPRLVVLDMRFSKLVQVWEGSKSLQNLKIIDLSYSVFLTKTPDFSKLPNLEELIMESCERLSEIDPSIGHLKRLSLVDLGFCYSLCSLPRDFYKSKSVETLILYGCRLFSELPEDLGKMVSLRNLELSETAIVQLPASIVELKNLTHLYLHCVVWLGGRIRLPSSLHGLISLRELDLSCCELRDDEIPKDLGNLISLQDLNLEGSEFHTLPSLSGLSKLQNLTLNRCIYLHTIPDLPINLKFLYAFDCPALETMPNFSEMSNMRELNVRDSPKLTEVPGLDKSLNSMTWIDMRRCTNLTAEFRKNILQGWTSCGYGGIFLNGNYVPDWFEFVNDGSEVSFDIPPSDDRNFEGLTLFCFYHSSSRYDHSLLAITVINNTKRTELRACIDRDDWEEIIYDDHYLWQGQLSNDKLNLQGGDKVDISFADSDISWTIKRTGVNLVWEPMKENMHDFGRAGYVFDPHPAWIFDEPSDDYDLSSYMGRTIAVHDRDPLGQLVQVWEGSKSLQNLKRIDLSYSVFLIKTPDFSKLPNLEELIMAGCKLLSEIDPSIGHLKRLSLVDLTNCHNLSSLPRDFYKSKSVETLILSCCHLFSELPEDIGKMVSLRKLELTATSIAQLPASIVELKNLTYLYLHCVVWLVGRIRLPYSLHGLISLRELDLSCCQLRDDEIPKDLGNLISLEDLDLEVSEFHTLPSLCGLSKLQTLTLNRCIYLHTIPDLPINLKFLYAFDCPALETMPNFSGMSNMRELNVRDSPKLTEVPGLDKSLNSMTWIDMKRCTNLTAEFRKNILQGWTSCGYGGIFLHGNYVPDWFEFVNDGSEVSFDIPRSDDRNFEGLTLFCFYHSSNRYDHSLLAITVINNTKRTELRACIDRDDWEEIIYEDHYLWQGQLSNDKLNLRGGDKVDISFADSDISWTIKRTGVNLVWEPMKENMHDFVRAGYVFDPHPAWFYDEPSDDYDPSSHMGSTIAVHDHDPLGLAHLRLSLSLDALPAGHHIPSRLRRPHLRQAHSQPRTLPKNLPALFQPQSSGVSDSGEQISDPMDDNPIDRLCKSFACMSLSPDHSSTFGRAHESFGLYHLERKRLRVE